MTKYITLNLPDGVCLKLLFIRMHEDDEWTCHLTNNMMQDIQKVIGQGFYGSI